MKVSSMLKKILEITTGTVLLTAFTAGCSSKTETASAATNAVSNLPKVDMNKWSYNPVEDLYYQTGILYAENPADTKYETCGIFVPGAYFKGTKNSDGTYSVTVKANGKVKGFTASTAPIVIPVNTPGYSAMSAPSGYVSDAAQYTEEGFIYFNPGCRGRNEGAPYGVTDLKAAIRYYRYCSDLLPGNTAAIFSFGMSGGGAQSALLGATGDSELYEPYLKEIGAVENVSDAILGSMDWCPITNLDTANEAYEWNMGCTRDTSKLSDVEKNLSAGLTEAFASYINSLGLKDDSGNVLTLQQSEDGNWQSGSYYNWILSEVERSLNNFLADTKFPYDASSSNMNGPMGGMGGIHDMGGFGGPGMGNGNGPDGNKGNMAPPDGKNPPDGMGKAPDGKGKPDGMNPPDGKNPPKPGDGMGERPEGMGEKPEGMGMENMDFTQLDNIMRNQAQGNATISGTYNTPEDYINALNAEEQWVIYDSKTNTAKVTSLAAFAKAVKPATKNTGAFDDLKKSQGENTLFGNGNSQSAHFDSTMAKLLEGTEYEASYASDMNRTDSTGNTVQGRINMYTPLYYLLPYYEGYKTSTPAKYWRIRTGIFQGDTSVTTEANLAQALKDYGLTNVDFEMVWGQHHTMAERSGSSTDNFIEWVKDCVSQEK